MLLQACLSCSYGAEKDGKSHCSRESVYSYLTRCIHEKALRDYLARESVSRQMDEAV